MKGIKFRPDPNEFEEIARKYRGNVVHISHYYKVDKNTIRLYLYDNPEHKELVHSIRSTIDAEFIGKAEHAYMKNLDNMENDPKTALAAAKYVLQSRGKKWGWDEVASESDKPSRDEIIEIEHENLMLKEEIRRLKNAGNERQADAELLRGDPPV